MNGPLRVTRSAYGGVIALNRAVDRATAERLSEQFIEVLLAPGYDEEALALLTEKKNVRLLALETGRLRAASSDAKPVIGGLLVQDRDAVGEGREQMSVLTKAPRRRRSGPTSVRVGDLPACALECDRDREGGATIGIGAGQMSRVDAVRIAVEKARRSSRSCWPAQLLPLTPSSPSRTAPSWRSMRA